MFTERKGVVKIMPFRIKQIKAMLAESGMPSENIEECSSKICELHKVVVDDIIEERDEYKKDSDTLKNVQKELDDLKKNAEKEGKNPFEAKYSDLKKEYDEYKQGVEKEKVHTKKEAAYRQLLKSAGVAEKRIDSILKVSDIDSLEFDEKDAVKDSEKHTNLIKNEWADFIESTTTEGANTSNPPGNASQTGNGKRTGRAAELAKHYQETMYGVSPTQQNS